MRDWIYGTLVSLAIVAMTGLADSPPPESVKLEVEGQRPQTSRAPRDPKQVRLFRLANPCPETGKKYGACPGWIIDHIIPLCWGGADDPANMQWQQKEASLIKDKFEREACALKRKYTGSPRK